MPVSPEEHGLNQAPLYIRWGPDGSSYAIEFKLELVGKIRSMAAEPSSKGFESGGILVGSLPSSHSPTLRIEDAEFIPRDDKDGQTFIVDPNREDKFADVRGRARETGRLVVGLFRTHLRPGALRPSLADRGLVAGLFTESVCALLLIEANEPFLAAFFIAKDRQLPAEPSVREFTFNEQEFKLLPELEPEPSSAYQRPLARTQLGTSNRVPLWTAVTLSLIGLIWYLNLWEFAIPATLPFFGSTELRLTIAKEGPGLRVEWNHSSRVFDHASGALLRVKAGSHTRDIRIGLDELRLGAVEIENDAPRVEVAMVALDMSGAASATETESATWPKR